MQEFTIIVHQHRHVNGDYRGEWEDSLYYNIGTGWEDKQEDATRFLSARPRRAFVNGVAIGITANEAIKLLGLDKEEHPESNRVLSRRYALREVRT